jgi:hypothetical protein
MAYTVIAAYRPKPGQATELLALVREHLPILRKQGLATEAPPVVLRATDGTLLEIFDWVSEEAVARAHESPEVLALWERFGAACDYVKLGELTEATKLFPDFERIII